jgi:hypothetical protein
MCVRITHIIMISLNKYIPYVLNEINCLNRRRISSKRNRFSA